MNIYIYCSLQKEAFIKDKITKRAYVFRATIQVGVVVVVVVVVAVDP